MTAASTPAVAGGAAAGAGEEAGMTSGASATQYELPATSSSASVSTDATADQIGTIHGRLEWPLRKDSTHKSRGVPSLYQQKQQPEQGSNKTSNSNTWWPLCPPVCDSVAEVCLSLSPSRPEKMLSLLFFHSSLDIPR